MKYTTEVGENGEFHAPTELIPGRYKTTINYTDNKNQKFGSSEWTGKLHIRHSVYLECKDISVDAYSTTTIKERLVDYQKEPLVNAEVKMKYSNSSTVTTLTTDSEGYFSFVYNATRSGTVDVTFSYAGSKYYIPITGTITITTLPSTPTITISDVKRYIKQDLEIPVTLSVHNHKLINKTLIFTINNNTYTVTTDSGGNATLTGCSIDTTGTYNCTVSYTPSTEKVNGRCDSWDYNSVSKSFIIIVMPKRTPIVTATVTSPVDYKGTSNFVLTYVDPATNQPVSGVGIIIQIPRESFSDYLITDSNGQISLSHTMTVVGLNDIVFITNERRAFNRVRVSKVVIVNPVQTKLSGTTNSIMYSEEASVTCTLTDVDGNKLSNKRITVYSNDGDFVGNGTTNNNGQCIIKFTPANVGTLTYTLQFEGDNQYASQNAQFTLTVQKISTKFTGNTTISPHAGEETPITLTLVTNKGKTLPNRTITVTDNNKTITTTSDSKGQFTFNTIGGLNEKRSATVKYLGDTYYNTCTATITLNFGKYVPTLNVDTRENSIGSPCVFYVKVSGANNVTPTGSVTYEAESQKNTVTLSPGEWSICDKYVPTEAGYNDITLTYKGDDNYISVTKDISVYTSPGIVEDCSSLDHFYIRTIKYQDYYPTPTENPIVDGGGIHGFYGRAIWAENLKVTNNCKVTMEIQVKNVDHGFNFGLVTKGNMSRTAVLLEQSSSRAYFYFATNTNGKYNIPSVNWNRLSLNTWYTVEFNIQNGKCTVKVNNSTYTHDIIIDDNTYPAIFVWSPRLSGESSSSEIICRKIVLIKR